jgi:hypothetical protein
VSDPRWLATAETQVLGLLLKHGVSADGIPLKPERFRDKLLSRVFAGMVELRRPANVGGMRARTGESELWRLCVQLADAAPEVEDVNHAIEMLVAQVCGRNEPLPSTQPAGKPVVPESGPRAPTRPGTWRDKLIDAQVLCERRFSEVRYVVPGLFPEGVTLLASRPKIGKSWLLLQITTDVSGGTTTLVPREQPIQGDVLYLALEDNPRRLQRRLTKYFGLSRENWPARLRFATNWRRLHQGGLDDLREWCASVTSPRLIAIDTLQKVRQPKGKGQSDYDADYAACEGLQKLAGDFGVAIIVAHHDRKMDAEDVFDTVSGTLGLTGAVDTVALIKRRPQATTLHIEGRDLVGLIEKAISFDQATCRWIILGEAAEVLRSAARSRVLKALADAPRGLSPMQIVEIAELRNRNAADLLLSRMTTDREVERVTRGVYGLPGTRAKLSGETDRQKDRKKSKLVKLQVDNSVPVDLSICPENGNQTEQAGERTEVDGSELDL